MPPATSVTDRLRSLTLTSAEQRVAEVILADPERVAFGTVADIAAAANTGGATVMRLAAKAGFEGFRQLQESVQHDITRRLRPASERIREQPTAQTPRSGATTEVLNVQRTLDGVDAKTLKAATRSLIAAKTVAVISSDAAGGVAAIFAADLEMLRPDVVNLAGSTVANLRVGARLGKGDVVVVVDVARYDRAVVDVVGALARSGVSVISLTDSPLAPVAKEALASFTFADAGMGPFDSYVGALALLNLLVAEVARLRNESATKHLDRLEASWTDLDALIGD